MKFQTEVALVAYQLYKEYKSDTLACTYLEKTIITKKIKCNYRLFERLLNIK